MTPARTPPPPTEQGAHAILRAFDLYERRFQAITTRARERFLARDWQGSRHDTVARLDIYGRILRKVVDGFYDTLGPYVRDRALWTQMRGHYAALVARRPDIELAETFFNSVTRQIFDTVGVDFEVEFVRHMNVPPTGRHSVYSTWPIRGSLRWQVRQVLDQPRYPFIDIERCADRVVAAIEDALAARERTPVLEALELINKGFYRGNAVYLVGRILLEGERLLPFVIAMRHEPEGVEVDAVLTTEDELSILFSFARTYFRVDVEHVGKVIEFLRTIMPRKPLAELYNSLGYNKHGKTELFRTLLWQLEHTDARFGITEGDKGMVMIVFDMPGLDLVFKVIRDRFAYPKTATRAHVLQRYELVFRHDRAGRLIDAQEFEHLRFDRARFTDELLAELAAEASGSVRIDDDTVHFTHVYTERRLRPLNLFLREASRPLQRRAVAEYGYAIRDLANTNIFPGDLLLKNFGVTRHGRVIFYDYDELCLLTECRFRDLPEPADDTDDMRGEAWFYVAENDVFPEEFLPFLGFTEEQRDWFLEEHGELLEAAWWRALRTRHEAGEVIDVRPYRPDKRVQGWR